MALHKDFPKDKFAILEPEIRWFPADEALREQGYEKLLPPFVPELRKRVKAWRGSKESIRHHDMVAYCDKLTRYALKRK